MNGILTSISISPQLIEEMNRFILTKTKNNRTINTSITIKAPSDLIDYYSFLPWDYKSLVVREMIQELLKQVKKRYKNYEKVFLSRSSLIRQAILNDILKPIKERILTRKMLECFFDCFSSISLLISGKYDIRKRNSYIPLGNTFHPQGKWRNHNIGWGIAKYRKFYRIYNKVKEYFSERYISIYWNMFVKADKLGLLDNIKNESDLRRIYEL